MGTKRTAAKTKATPIVGSRVRFVFGLGEVTGIVIEDRGNLGGGGRRLLRVRFEIEGAGDALETEIAADDVKRVA